MAISSGALAGYLLLGIVLNVALILAIFFYNKKRIKDGKSGINVNLSEKLNGAFRWILFVLITTCWILAIYATAACTFLEVTLPFAGFDITFGLGFTNFYLPAAIANPAECQGFESDSTGYFEQNTTALIFAIFNCILTGFSFVGILLIQFILRIAHVRTKLWLAMRIVMYGSVWCALCSFYIRQTHVCDQFDCSLGKAGIAQVFNVLCNIIVCIVLFITDCGEESAFDKCRTKTRVVQVPAGTILPRRI